MLSEIQLQIQLPNTAIFKTAERALVADYLGMSTSENEHQQRKKKAKEDLFPAYIDTFIRLANRSEINSSLFTLIHVVLYLYSNRFLEDFIWIWERDFHSFEKVFKYQLCLRNAVEIAVVFLLIQSMKYAARLVSRENEVIREFRFAVLILQQFV